MPKINIVGVGTGNILHLTKEAEFAVTKSRCLIGDKRVLKLFDHLHKTVVITTNVDEIKVYIDALHEDDEVSILVSGDVGFYSLAKSLLSCFPNKDNFNLICGIGSLQYFCSKIKTSWDDCTVVSLHGRNENIIGKVANNKKVFVLTGGKTTPSDICKILCEYGFESLSVAVGENLSYANERIIEDTALNVAEKEFETLSVMLIFNENAVNRFCTTHGLQDEMFIRGDVPMTKQEVRSVSLSKLQLKECGIAFDIGSGTGSVAIEMALQMSNGFVYAIEKESAAVSLIQRNKEKFKTANLRVIQATAPEEISSLPKPDKVFIGGSNGNLKTILDAIYNKNDHVTIVINAITLETLNEVVNYYNEKLDYEVEIVNISVSKAKKVSDYHLMMGQNPVFIITANRKEIVSAVEL